VSTVATIQTRLEKALQRASQSDDRELAGRIREEGHRLVFLLNGLLRSSRMYSTDNTALEAPSREFSGALRGLLDLLGVVHVVCVEDQIYVNDVRLRVRQTEQPVIDNLAAELGRHDVGGISFHQPLDAGGVKDFAAAVAGAAAETRPRAALAARLASLGDMDLSGKWRFRLAGDSAPTQHLDYVEVLRRAGSVVTEAVANLAAGRLPNPLPVRRAVMEMADGLSANPALAAVTPLRHSVLGPGERHLVSVANLALLLGRALGLPSGALSDLGVAAMLHDVGYARGADRAGHAAAGARVLARQRGFHEAKIRRLLAVLDHHQPHIAEDHAAGERSSLFSRILRIAEDYDLLVGARDPSHRLLPAMALAALWAGRGRDYDPILLALFAQALGRFPAGSLLELSDGRWALVVSGGRDRERFKWPIVRTVRAADGRILDMYDRIDLHPNKTILNPRRILDPQRQGFDLEAAVERAFAPPAEA
jgi:HD domain